MNQIPAVIAIFLIGSLSSIAYGQADPLPQEASDPKGAIIIASIEGKVTVTNNLSGAALPVAAGKILFDGHTIKTGPNGKIILLFSTGTVTTLKADSILNIKKFTQGKIPAGTNLNTIKEEPSASDVLIDLNVGDMVVDIKKLKKESSFDIDSPVGTAGIRGTRVGMNIRPAPGGGWMSKITVPRGAISFIPLAILGAPPPIPVPVFAGQSVAPAVTDTGAVAAAPVAAPAAAGDLAAINADLDDAGAAANNAIDNVAPIPSDGPDAEDAPESDGEEEAPSEEEINEEDDERQAASKGVNDKNSSSEAVALDKAGLIDLDNPEQLQQVETFVEVTEKAATMFKSKQDDEETQRKAGRRVDGDDESKSFLDNLIKRDEEPYKKDANGDVVLDKDEKPVPNPNYGKLPLANVVDVTESAQSVGANDASTLTAVLDNAEMADELKVVIDAADEIGSKNKDTLGAVLRNADQGDKLANVVETENKKKQEVQEKLKAAQDAGGDVAAIEQEIKEAAEASAKKGQALFKVVKKVDAVQQEEKAQSAANEKAAADKMAADEALKKAEQDAVLAAEINAKAVEDAAKLAAEETAKKEGKSADDIAAAIAAAEAKAKSDAADSAKALADAAALKVTAAKSAFGEAVSDIEAATSSDAIDGIISAFEATHTSISRVGFDLADSAISRKDSLTVKLDSTNVFNKFDDVVSLTETATSVNSEAGFESILVNAENADKVVSVINAAKDAGAADSFAAVLKSADKAVQMEQVVAAENAKKKKVEDDARAAGKSEVEIAAEIKTAGDASAKKAKALFNVVKKVDTARDAQKIAAETPAEPGGETPVETAPAVKVDDVFNNFAAVVDLADKAGDIAGAGGDSDLLDSVLNNADQANELKEMVEKSETVALEAKAKAETAALAALGDGATEAEKVAAKAAASETVAGASLTTLFVNADKASDLKAMVLKSEGVALASKAKAVAALGEGATDAQKAAAEEAVAAPALTNLFENASQASDLKAMVEKSETVALAAKAKAVAALGEGASQAQRDAAEEAVAAPALTTLFENASQASDLKAMVEKSETVALAAKAKAVAALGEGATDAQKDAAEEAVAAPALTTLFENAAQASDLKAMVERSEGVALAAKAKAVAALGEGASQAQKDAAEEAVAAPALTNLFENADKAANLAKVVAAAGEGADLTNVLANADKADSYAKVVDQIASLNFVGDQANDIFDNIDVIADVLGDVTTEGAVVNADVARNLLGNAKEAKQMQDALLVIKEASAGTGGGGAAPSLAQLENIVKKDVKELVAINNVAKKLKESGEGGAAALEAFVNQNIEKAAQLEQAFEGNADLAGQIAAQAKAKADADAAAVAALGEGATDAEKAAAIAAAAEVDGAAGALNIDSLVDASALGSLKTVYAGTDYLSVLEKPENADKADDIAFALSFIKSGKSDLSADEAAKETANEAAFFANIDKLDDLIDLGLKFEDDPTKMDTIFNNLDRLDALKELSDQLAVYPDRIKLVFENAEKADALLGTVKDIISSGSETLMDSLFESQESLDATMANQGLIKLTTDYPQYGDAIAQYGSKAAEIAATAEDFKDDSAKLDLIFGNLDKLDAVNDMTARYGADADKDKIDKLFENFDKLDEIKKLSDRLEGANLDGAQDRLFENIDRLDDFETGLDIFTEAGILKQLDSATAEQVAMIFDIGDAFNGDAEKLKIAGSNLDKLSDLKALAENNDLDAAKLDLVFANPDKAGKIKEITDAHGTDAGSRDAIFDNLDSLDQFEMDPDLIKIAEESPGDFKSAKESGQLSSTLLNELKKLGLEGEELKMVLADLNTGPAEGQQPGDAPTSTPVDPNTVSLLANHEIKDNTINPNLVLTAELAFASSFFQDVVQVYDNLSGPSDTSESITRNFNVIGGKNVSISAGDYDIGNVYGGPGQDEFLIAATDKLTIAGNAAFRNTDETMASTTDGLILLSAGSVSLPQGTVDQRASVSYAGDMLGIGSMETLNVINVDLQAEGEVSLRSLDSLVIENSKMITTNGNGADFVHLRALDEINANGLLFSANVQQIVMDAMTINLANVTFPGGSTVNLNSALGPLDSKYPTFGLENKAYGRVNFIQNVRYGTSLLLNTRTAFNSLPAGSITIGTK
ncbi:MAG: FecR domain-containing protein [Verrucomicrobia bacterium]|nr:FecR domain-containing protein [Verrucomicrobiota bacterium]